MASNTTLKTSLFGYQKASVCEYVSKLNDEFSQRLSKLEREHQQETAALTAQIDALQAEQMALTAELSSLGQARATLIQYRSTMEALRAQIDALLSNEAVQLEISHDETQED